MTTVVFYISGHGFGHASRVIEVINALLAARPDLRIIVRTTAPKWLFDLTVRRPPRGNNESPGRRAGLSWPERRASQRSRRQSRRDEGRPGLSRVIEYHQVECDTGIVQIDSLHLDADETVRRARDFMRTFDVRVADELAFLAREQPSLVVADAPPLGIAAGAAAGLPTVGLGNFTWDWIYSAYPGTGELVAALSTIYSRADAALRLPMHGGFTSISKIVDLPFVARRSSREPAETKQTLGLPLVERLVLVSFGGYGLDGLDLDALSRLEGYAVLVSGSVPLAELPAGLQGGRRGSLVPVDETAMYDAGFRYEDLVRAVDVVMTKPGYGIIAECLANDTALLYTSRGHFIEYDVLVAAMPRFLRAGYIDHADLFAGRWGPHLDALLAQPDPGERPAVNGAEVTAAALLGMMTA